MTLNYYLWFGGCWIFLVEIPHTVGWQCTFSQLYIKWCYISRPRLAPQESPDTRNHGLPTPRASCGTFISPPSNPTEWQFLNSLKLFILHSIWIWFCGLHWHCLWNLFSLLYGADSLRGEWIERYKDRRGDTRGEVVWAGFCHQEISEGKVSRERGHFGLEARANCTEPWCQTGDSASGEGSGDGGPVKGKLCLV